MSYKIITIGREYGSGGRKIAQKVAEALSLVYYDNEIIDMAAQEMGFDVEMIRRAAETKSSSFLYTMTTGAFDLPLNDKVFAMQSQIIKHLANCDECIIVSGCGDYILVECVGGGGVFIHAPVESRRTRVLNEYHEDEGDVEKKVHKMDKRRSSYYNYYTTNKWGDLRNYDLTINSDIGIDEAAQMIVEAYNTMK